jgi:hypothetical protein
LTFIYESGKQAGCAIASMATPAALAEAAYANSRFSRFALIEATSRVLFEAIGLHGLSVHTMVPSS